MEKDNSKMQCRKFTCCSAALCPLYNDGGVWYPNEGICSLRNSPGWVRTQRKIAKVTGEKWEVGYFTVGLLLSIKRVKKGIRGRNPDNSKNALVEEFSPPVRPGLSA